MLLDEAERTQCLKLARLSLQSAFAKTGEIPETAEPSGALLEILPCFVSLHTRGHRLRGCVGCVETDKTLADNIQRMTLAAAFHDPRFRPLGAEEVARVFIEISVLGPQKRLPSLDDLRLGEHGLRVHYQGSSGLLLAQVATEHRFSREDFLVQTCHKAGLPPEGSKQYEVFYFEQQAFSEGH